jgi:tetratricopeptide (TPR) repeat protein
MASLIPGYEYDIFISYRQKDNKYDGWVTEFVDNLKKELEATFKEEVSVYFDINPHDGLLETHDVDASLKDKLKCLVFIPIISRTYCDPKSFAWEHEFKAFVEMASHDQFGSKVKLPNGNIANRILPVRIHDLDINDIKLCESIIGGVLRDIEFIYKSEGVNRPLRSKEDKPDENLNKTIYRDQVNKTALAIKEIILGLKGEPDMSVEKSTEHREQERAFYEVKKPAKSTKQKLLIGAGILAILIIAALFVYPGLIGRNNLARLISKDGRIPIVVMPFQNMTNDTLWNVWQDGIQNILITSLSNSKELKVRQLESITGLLQSRGLNDYTSLTPSVASSISQKLKANVHIWGSIKQSGTIVRLNAQLIDTKTGEAFKSFQIDGTADSILPVIDSLSQMVQDFLIISVMKKEVTFDEKHFAVTSSPEAFRYYMYGQKAFGKPDWPAARDWYLKAVSIDSNFIDAALQISFSYGNQGLYKEAKQWCLRFYKKRDVMPMIQKIWINYTYANYFETPNEEIKYLRQLQELDDLLPTYYFLTGVAYFQMYQWDKAITELEKALETDLKLNSKPGWSQSYAWLGWAYCNTGQYKKGGKLLNKSEKYFPDDPELIQLKAIISLAEGDTIDANRYIEKYRSILKDNSMPEPVIIANIASIYSEGGFLDKAEEYYRHALSMRPDSPNMLNNLAWFLIEKDRNINEGMELIDKALGKKPDNYGFIDTKGWGLYKQGKYEEALEFLEKSWELRPVYDHEAFIHLEAAKKAVAGQKNN